MQEIDTELLFHAMYVAFAFSCLLFGALAFRQVLDNLEVRRMALGEDRKAYLSPVGTIVLVAGILLTSVVAWITFSADEPSVYSYALPLVLAVQNIQLGLRLWFQRAQVKTRGLVIRPVVLGYVQAIPFEDMVSVLVEPLPLWTTIRIETQAKVAAHFRIFRASQAQLVAILGNACSCRIEIEHP
jgi:hypothetical protein